MRRLCPRLYFVLLDFALLAGLAVGCNEYKNDDDGPAPVDVEACQDARDMGVLVPGDSALSPQDTAPPGDGGHWFHASFPMQGPPEQSFRPGGGVIRVGFEVNEYNSHVMDVHPNCESAPTSCNAGEAAATGVRDWSFEDPADCCVLDVHDIPWPEDLWVRVYRVGGSPSSEYQLLVSR